MGVDQAFEHFKQQLDSFHTAAQTAVTEQDARFQLINEILTTVLGWEKQEIKTEPPSESGYSDYLLRHSDQTAMVVEAKRLGKILLNTSSTDIGYYKISGPALKAASEGIRQAAGYALDHGSSLCCLTTGDVWIGFQINYGSGIPYRESKAVVFPGLISILNDFAIFYELFSKEAFTKRLFKTIFVKAEGLSNVMFETLDTPNRESELVMIPKSPLATDIDPIFREFFGVLSGEDDRQMLMDCFVESRESKHADLALDKIVKSIHSTVSTLTPGTGAQLATEINAAVETRHGENVVIIGNKGSGKSTFVDRFFRSVLSPTLRANCLVVKLDLLDASGQKDNLQEWLADKLVKTLEHRLFRKGIPTFAELKGIYFKEYEKWKLGQHATLFKTNADAFNIKFGEYIDEQMRRDRSVYLMQLLQHAVWSRKLLPCLIFDNADHHDSAFQETVFQWSQFLRREVPYTFVVMPVTDRTIWRLSKAGPFQTYKSKLLYLPVPSTRQVLEKRINYLKERSKPRKGSQQYFLGKGVRLSVENINAFAASVEQIFIKEDFVSRRISWLANHDIRRSLILSQSIATSPYLSIDDLVTAYLKYGAQATLTIGYEKFMHALVLGEYNQFQEEKNPFVLNLFTISKDAPSSPLTCLSILRLLQDRAGEDVISNHLTAQQIVDILSAMGVNDVSTHFSLARLLEYRLIEPYDASSDALHTDERYAISHSGRMHIEMALTDSVYLTQIAFSTGIRTSTAIDKMRAAKQYHGRISDEHAACREFISYCLQQDLIFINVPNDPMFDGQRQLRKDLAGNWVIPTKNSSKTSDTYNSVVAPETQAVQPAGYGEVTLVVSSFNNQRGFGFCSSSDVRNVFLHMKTLKASGFQEIEVGDEVRCDVALDNQGRNNVTIVYAVTEKPKKDIQAVHSDYILGEFLFFNKAKGFGFVKVPGYREDAFLSAKLAKETTVLTMAPGTKVQVRVGLDPMKNKLAVQALTLKPSIPS